MSEPNCVFQTELDAWPRRQGKVRDIYDLGEELLIVASDRISAFDVVMPKGIPEKGVLLTQISAFWFDWLSENLGIKHHVVEVVGEQGGDSRLEPYRDQLRGRSMLVRKSEVLPVECVVRGYLAGSGWREYQQSQSVCGVKLPAGLKQSDRLEEPIFTPATKATDGHDLNICFEAAADIIGSEAASYVQQQSIAIYRAARDYARERGIILADTKFEWGYRDGELILIDEVLTPDSSRFWPADQYRPGRDQPSFDKQYVRNYLDSLDWDKTPPAPALPEEVVAGTRARYIEAYEQLTARQYCRSA